MYSTYTREWVDGFFKYDKHILTSGDWLSDKLVNAAQNLILQVHPHVCGFQNTNLGLTLAFNIMTSEFVQVLHNGCGHWVAISTIGCKLGEVNIYDSMRSALTESLKRQIPAILCLPIQTKEVTLKYKRLHSYLLLILLFTYVGIVIVNCKLDQLIVGCLLLQLSQF